MWLNLGAEGNLLGWGSSLLPGSQDRLSEESRWDAGKANWQTLAVLGAGAGAEVTPPQWNRSMTELGLWP